MGREIERKFLVADPTVIDALAGTPYRQGYLSTVAERTVRVRRAGERAYITLKGLSRGAERAEFEYEIPPEQADEILSTLCERPLIEKRRYRLAHGRHVWEIDVFEGVNEGLVVAEVELAYEAEAIELPPWVGAEVTNDARYFNACLVRHPFREWKAEADVAEKRYKRR